MTLNYENDGIFLIMGNAGFITSTVRVICFGGPMLYIYSFLLSSTAVHVNATLGTQRTQYPSMREYHKVLYPRSR